MTRPGSDGSHYTVLLVDDQDGVREVARRILQWQGHRVLEAADGSAALEVTAAAMRETTA